MNFSSKKGKRIFCNASNRLVSSPSPEKSRGRRLGTFAACCLQKLTRKFVVGNLQATPPRRKIQRWILARLQMSQVRLSRLFFHIFAPFFTARVRRHFQPFESRTLPRGRKILDFSSNYLNIQCTHIKDHIGLLQSCVFIASWVANSRVWLDKFILIKIKPKMADFFWHELVRKPS